MRTIERHRKGDPLNHEISIVALDEPGPGGACHQYQLSLPDPESEDLLVVPLHFQKGGVVETGGVNGISNEALLAVVEDRLSGFAQGPFADQHTIEALRFVTRALKALEIRTLDRIARGVEGQQKQ